ncbi:DUF3237 family protein [Rhodococcus sp. NPDC003322]
MSLRLESLGTLVVHIDQSWRVENGPIAVRSCSSFKQVVWESPLFTARSVWANGEYLQGDHVAEPNIRIMFKTDDDSSFYLSYGARTDLPTHHLGKSPVIMTGRIEAGETNPKYNWLNRTQIVGHGMLDVDAGTQSYQISVLRWDGDTGPRFR